MKKFKFTIRGNEYDVLVKYFEDGEAKVEVNGSPYHIAVEKTVQESKTPIIVRPDVKNPKNAHKIKKKASSGLTKITAPLPGNIMNIYVKEGDQINKGDKLLMYEAMKMENLIVAEKDGIVKSIKVQSTDSVLQGDILIEVE
jgi:biotin carboxyl carrier protein